ncbi:Protein kinase [Metarhizium rileyi]|uniref:Protein kinase n=1 Tax=Metarhizium rileyi (strain RCEF 4871) TaxID=1649241 RepID=A0A162JG94_METRR|nr:Protein kinase [Metarhizium rileyi RCEF 4871]TWU73391.1 hypothetical protein ED733_002872 [Metarhizium rileyi]
MSVSKNKIQPKAEPSDRRPLESLSKMNKDSSFTYVHMTTPSNADLFEDFCKDKLPSDDIFVPPQHQPLNPEDEDDVVPDQHAAFGITRATKDVRGAAWKDLGLEELMRRGPPKGVSGKRLPR